MRGDNEQELCNTRSSVSWRTYADGSQGFLQPVEGVPHRVIAAGEHADGARRHINIEDLARHLRQRNNSDNSQRQQRQHTAQLLLYRRVGNLLVRSRMTDNGTHIGHAAEHVSNFEEGELRLLVLWQRVDDGEAEAHTCIVQNQHVPACAISHHTTCTKRQIPSKTVDTPVLTSNQIKLPNIISQTLLGLV